MNLATKALVGLASAALVSSAVVLPAASSFALTNPNPVSELCGYPPVEYSYAPIPAAEISSFASTFAAADGDLSVKADLVDGTFKATVVNSPADVVSWHVRDGMDVDGEFSTHGGEVTVDLTFAPGERTITATPIADGGVAYGPALQVSLTVGNVPAPSKISQACSGEIQSAPGGIFVAWKNEGSDQSTPGTYFKVRFQGQDNGFDKTYQTASPGVRIADLPPGDYRYTITTLNADGFHLEDSSVRMLRVYDLPAAPSNLTATPQGGNVQVAWDTADAKGKVLSSWMVSVDLDRDGEFWSEGEQLEVQAADLEGFSRAELNFPGLANGDYDVEVYSVASDPYLIDGVYTSPVSSARATVTDGVTTSPDVPPVEEPETPVESPEPELPVESPAPEVPSESPTPSVPEVPVSPGIPTRGNPTLLSDGSRLYVGVIDSVMVRVYGAIGELYSQRQGDLGLLGAPASEEFSIRDGGQVQRFQNGLVYWTKATGANEVHGAIGDRFGKAGWENSALGYPKTSELSTPDQRGRFNHFENGSIYWTPETGAQVVRGAIGDAWSRSGWERSAVGYPTGEEFSIRDGGQVQRFQNGLVYWTKATGAHLVHGAFQGTFASQGWENGSLGYPTSEELPTATGVVQHYQGGTLSWDKTTGKVTRS